ncbi:MAG: hypothetical protein JWO68_3947 [Actinomycetia bacterium]|nr:hypothetical protein [Actinomycetes bacterium]
MLFDEIRARCRLVAEGAGSVHIAEDRLEAYASELRGVLDAPVDDDPGRVRLGTVADTVAFVVGLDAVNFGSGWFPVLRKPPGLSGYHTVASTLREHGAPTARWLAEVDTAACCALFGQDPESPAAELMARFAEAWNQLGRLLLERYDGEAVHLVEAAGGSAAALVELLRQAPHFDDRRTWRGLDVPFYKRAQITAADLDAALGGAGPGRFDDLDRLTIFADNLVPHVLRVDGVLVLDPELEASIDAGELVPEGSEAEVELRAGAVDAVERLVALLPGQTSARLDTVLWNRGAGATYKARPRHRTRTVAY